VKKTIKKKTPEKDTKKVSKKAEASAKASAKKAAAKTTPKKATPKKATPKKKATPTKLPPTAEEEGGAKGTPVTPTTKEALNTPASRPKPGPDETEYALTLPKGTPPGGKLRFTIPGTAEKVDWDVPKDAGEGDTISIILPSNYAQVRAMDRASTRIQARVRGQSARSLPKLAATASPDTQAMVAAEKKAAEEQAAAEAAASAEKLAAELAAAEKVAAAAAAAAEKAAAEKAAAEKAAAEKAAADKAAADKAAAEAEVAEKVAADKAAAEMAAAEKAAAEKAAAAETAAAEKAAAEKAVAAEKEAAEKAVAAEKAAATAAKSAAAATALAEKQAAKVKPDLAAWQSEAPAPKAAPAAPAVWPMRTVIFLLVAILAMFAGVALQPSPAAPAPVLVAPKGKPIRNFVKKVLRQKPPQA